MRLEEQHRKQRDVGERAAAAAAAARRRGRPQRDVGEWKQRRERLRPLDGDALTFRAIVSDVDDVNVSHGLTLSMTVTFTPPTGNVPPYIAAMEPSSSRRT